MQCSSFGLLIAAAGLGYLENCSTEVFVRFFELQWDMSWWYPYTLHFAWLLRLLFRKNDLDRLRAQDNLS